MIEDIIDINEKCVCPTHLNCKSDFSIEENEVLVSLSPEDGEYVKAIVVDDCLIKTKRLKKCDALFVYEKDKAIKLF